MAGEFVAGSGQIELTIDLAPLDRALQEADRRTQRLTDQVEQEVASTAQAFGKLATSIDRAYLPSAKADQLNEKLRKQQEAAGFLSRAFEILNKDLTATNEKFGAGSVQVEKKTLAIDKLRASLATAERNIQSTKTALDAEAAAALHAATATTDLDKAAEHGGGSLSKMGELAKGALAGIGFAAVNAGLSAVSNAFDSVEHSIIGTNAQLQDSATSWGVLLGSADKAQAKLSDLSKFAAVTPFDFPEVDHAAKLMETFGGAALNTVKSLTLVGDVASGVNQPFSEVASWFGRMYSAIQSGRPFGEAAQRLQEMGAMSGETRNKLEDLQKSGAAAPEIWDTFTASLNRFGGMMAKQSQNWSGLTSTFSDSINLLAAQAGKPIFNELSQDLSKVNEYLASPAAEQASQHFADLAAHGVQKAVDGLGDLYTVGQSTAAFLGNNLGPAIQAVEAATAAYALRSLPAAIGELKTFVTLSEEAKLSLVTTYLPLALLAGEFYLAAKGGQELDAKLHALALQQEGTNEAWQQARLILQGINADYGATTPAIRDLAEQLDTLTQKQVDYLAIASRRGGGVAGAQSMRDATKAAADLNPQIAELSGRLDMMSQAASQLAIDKLAPPKGVWSAYSGEITSAIVATKELDATPLTGDALKVYEKIIEETTKAGQAAFSGMFDAENKYSGDSASLATKHWQTIAAIDKELQGKITKARRAELEQQRKDENTQYAAQTTDLKNALADQLAAQRSALGTMLRERLAAERGMPGIDNAKVDALIADTEKRYGLLPDFAAQASDASLKIVEDGIQQGSAKTTAQLGRDSDAIQRHYADLSATANNLRDLLKVQIETRMVGQDPVAVGQAVTREWGRAQALLAQYPDLAGKAFASVDELNQAVAHERLLTIHTEADTGDVPERLKGIQDQADAIDARAPAYVRVQTDSEITKDLLDRTTGALDLLDRHPVVDKAITSNAETVTGWINDTNSAYTGLVGLPVPNLHIDTNADDASQALHSVWSAYDGVATRAATPKTITVHAATDFMITQHSPSPIEQVMSAIERFEVRDHIFKVGTAGNLDALAGYTGPQNLDQAGVGYAGAGAGMQFMDGASDLMARTSDRLKQAMVKALATGDYSDFQRTGAEAMHALGAGASDVMDLVTDRLKHAMLKAKETGDFSQLARAEADALDRIAAAMNTRVAPAFREMPDWVGYAQDLGNGLLLLGDQSPGIIDLGDGLKLLGAAWEAMADQASKAAAATVKATDDILQHATFKGPTAMPGYNGPGAGMSFGGPHWGDPIVGPGSDAGVGGPSWGPTIRASQDAANATVDAWQTAQPAWDASWQGFQHTTTVTMDTIGTAIDLGVQKDQARIQDLVNDLNDAYNRAMAFNGLNVSGPSGVPHGGGFPTYVGVPGHASGLWDSPFAHVAKVGEFGPELMVIPQHASIIPHDYMADFQHSMVSMVSMPSVQMPDISHFVQSQRGHFDRADIAELGDRIVAALRTGQASPARVAAITQIFNGPADKYDVQDAMRAAGL